MMMMMLLPHFHIWPPVKPILLVVVLTLAHSQLAFVLELCVHRTNGSNTIFESSQKKRNKRTLFFLALSYPR